MLDISEGVRFIQGLSPATKIMLGSMASLFTFEMLNKRSEIRARKNRVAKTKNISQNTSVDEQKQIKNDILINKKGFFYSSVDELLNQIKKLGNFFVPSASSAVLSTMQEENYDKRFTDINFYEDYDIVHENFIRGSNIPVSYVENNERYDINFKVGVKNIENSDTYEFAMTVFGASKENFDKLESSKQKELINFAKIEYLDRLTYDTCLSSLIFEEIYGGKFIVSEQYNRIYNKFLEEIKQKKEYICSDIKIRKNIDVIEFSLMNAPVKKSTEYNIKNRLTTEQLIRLRDDGGYNTLDLITDKQADTIVKSEVVRLRNLGFDVNLVVRASENFDVAEITEYINRFKNLTGVKFDISEVKDTSNILDIFINPIVTNINFIMPDVNIKFGENVDIKTLSIINEKTNYSITLNEKEMGKLNNEANVLFNDFLEKGRIELEYENDSDINANNTIVKELMSIGIALSVKKVSLKNVRSLKVFQYQNKVKVSHSIGLSIGKKGFKEKFNINDFTDMLTEKDYNLDRFEHWYINNKDKLSLRMKEEVKIIMDENIEDYMKMKAIKQLVRGVVESSVEEEFIDTAVAYADNDIIQVLNVLSTNERKVLRYLLLQAKIAGIDLSNIQTMELFDQMSLSYARNMKQNFINSILNKINSSYIMFDRNVDLETERNIIETLDLLLKTGDMLVFDRNRDNAVKKSVVVSADAVRNLLASA